MTGEHFLDQPMQLPESKHGRIVGTSDMKDIKVKPTDPALKKIPVPIVPPSIDKSCSQG
jgi:hypothetical protein